MSPETRSAKARHRWGMTVLAVVAAAVMTAGIAYSALGDSTEDSVAAGDAPPPYAQSATPLRDAPWLSQPGGSPSIDEVEPRPSLRLPAGVGYAQTLRELYVAALEHGELPAGAALEAALPAEVVLVQPSEPGEGLRLSLSAPWGWDLDARAIRPPSLRLPGELAPGEVTRRIERARALRVAIPQGANVDVPVLSPCQVALGDPGNRPPCRAPGAEDSRWLAATSTNCAVNASGGYVNCLSYTGPGYETAKAHHAAGLSYRLQLHRPADGARWGYWQWNDLDHHTVSLNLSGSITAQIDNLGTANPASYYLEMG